MSDSTVGDPPAEDLPPRFAQDCDVCHVVDADPRHHTYDPAVGTYMSLHFRCCADRGCEGCAGVLAVAPAEEGAPLIDFIIQET